MESGFQVHVTSLAGLLVSDVLGRQDYLSATSIVLKAKQ